MLRQEFLLLLFKSLLEFIFNFLFLILKLFLEVKKSLINVLHLLKLKSFELLLDLLKQLRVLIIESLCVKYHLLKVKHILLETGCHFLYLYELMTIVLVEYAPDTYRDCAQLAEILDWLVVMTRAIDIVVRVSHCATCT